MFSCLIKALKDQSLAIPLLAAALLAKSQPSMLWEGVVGSTSFRITNQRFPLWLLGVFLLHFPLAVSFFALYETLHELGSLGSALMSH